MTDTQPRNPQIQKLQRAIVDGLEDVKGQDIVVFNTEHMSPLFERVIIASGTSNRQTKALAMSVSDAVREAGFDKPRIEGEENGEWIIVDCGSAVCHVMQPVIRQYYLLEDIWGGKPVRLKMGAERAQATAKKSAAKPVAKAATKSAAKPAAKSAAKAAPKAGAAPVAKAPGKTTTKTAAKAPAKTVTAKAGTKAGAAAIAKAAASRASAAKSAPAKSAAAKAPARKAVASKTAASKTVAPKVKTVVVGKPAAKSTAKASGKPAGKVAAKPATKGRSA